MSASPTRDVYVAIADPTRRRILELLRDEGTLTAGQIAGNFEGLSRPAISRHLRVLRECRVVDAARRGKEQRYSLDPEPLERVRDEWMATFTDQHNASLRALRRRVEGQRPG